MSLYNHSCELRLAWLLRRRQPINGRRAPDAVLFQLCMIFQFPFQLLLAPIDNISHAHAQGKALKSRKKTQHTPNVSITTNQHCNLLSTTIFSVNFQETVSRFRLADDRSSQIENTQHKRELRNFLQVNLLIFFQFQFYFQLTERTLARRPDINSAQNGR